MSLETLLTIAGSVLGSQVIVQFISSYFARKKDAGDFSLEFIKTVTQRVEKLETEIEALRKENVALHREVAALRAIQGYKANVAQPS